MTSVTDPVGTGLVTSLAHPGGNVTGLSNLSELSGKQLELLKEAFPKVTRVAVLWDPANTANARLLAEMKVAASGLRITLQPLEVNGPDDFQAAFSAIKKEHVSALIVLRNVITYTYGTRIVDLTAKSKLPAMYPDRVLLDTGGLMSYLEPRSCGSMMGFIHDYVVNPGNFIQTPHNRHDARDRDLSCEVAGSRIDAGELYSRPHEHEFFQGLPQKLVTMNKHKPLVVTSIQA